MYLTLRISAITAVLVLLASCSAARARTPEAPAPRPAVAEAIRETAEPAEVEAPRRADDLLGTVTYDLPVVAHPRVRSELDFLVGQRREVIDRWLERGDFYEPYIKAVLREHQIPTDLYHLAMIESGFVPTARSHAGAVGMWQFMPSTGRAMGLRIDSEVDERMDPVRSTRAAARHLRSLHRSLRDWSLAAAAYNAGSGRINRGMVGYGAADFWDLASRGDLAEETKRYVPRLYAVTVIGRDRARFGFAPPRSGDHFAYDSIHVEFATPLAELARLGAVGEADLRRLNPHLIRGLTPAGGYWVWVPRGHGPALQRAWAASEFRRARGLGTYTVRAGDNLGKLAQRSGIRASRIRELNPSVTFDPLQIGERLKLPFAAAETLTAWEETRAAPVAASPPRPIGTATATAAVPAAPPQPIGNPAPAVRTHRVAPGETVWSIARTYGVAVADIERANSLAGAIIRPDQVLTIPVAGVVVPPPPSMGAEDSRQHVVSAGETLWGIAQQYGTTVESIEQANDLSGAPIQPGQRLVIPRSAPHP